MNGSVFTEELTIANGNSVQTIDSDDMLVILADLVNNSSLILFARETSYLHVVLDTYMVPDDEWGYVSCMF